MNLMSMRNVNILSPLRLNEYYRETKKMFDRDTKSMVLSGNAWRGKIIVKERFSIKYEGKDIIVNFWKRVM